MLPFRYVAVFAFVAVSFAQDFSDYEPASPVRPAPSRVQPGYSGPAGPKPTPVPILKQINRHNEDGSYTYGYESADGSFKIETKLPNGEVKGKYGYVDDTGKVRVVEYGATKYGFEPAGEGITVAPPTLVDETTNKEGALLPEYSGAYYDQDQQQPQPLPSRPAPRPRPQPQPAFQSYSPPQQFEPAPAPVPQRAQVSGASLSSSQTFDFGPAARPAPARSFAPAPSRSFAPAPSRSFAPAPSRSFAPAPPRPAAVSYAEPAPIEEYEPAPAPRPQPKITYAQPAPLAARPAPSFAPAPRPAPQFAPRPSPSGPVGRGGILDQLSKDYALPSDGAAPLHDISFGYY
ncbi:nematocyst expressed protein 3-like [Aethina tumida]|uniref:nematocyst expressed protein 3-like n=1 Tax=Aethina tumida TaxID=116153 RepID=UPI002148B3F1|nr:nematocyst expressed protein 3-like [Aethina tumida]